MRNNWFNHEPSTSSRGGDHYRQQQQQQQQEIPMDIERRGDIPVMHGDCEGRLSIDIDTYVHTCKCSGHCLLKVNIGNVIGC